MVPSNSNPLSTPQRRLPVETLILTLFFLVTYGLAAVSVVIDYGHALTVAGPNTVGEAGKVYFAHRFQIGESMFATAEHPPYYPSFHGPLLHSLVGALGQITGASIIHLYGIGRTISVLATMGSFVLAGLMLRQLGTSSKWALVVTVVCLGMRDTFHHTISFRPDNWILCLTAFACYVMMAFGEKRWGIALATGIAVIAFFVKPTGISIAGCVVGALLLQHRWKAAVASGIGTILATTSIAFFINAASQGAYFEAMDQARGVPFRFGMLLTCLNQPVTWAPLIVPLALIPFVYRSPDGKLRTDQLTVFVFWSVSVIAACVAATRLGSNPYYMVSGVFLGMILTCRWLSIEVKRGNWNWKWRAVALIVIAGVPFVPPTMSRLYHTLILNAPLHDIAVELTEHFADERPRLAAMANDLEQPVYCDDPGFNVLLDRPGILHPMLVSMMVAQGSFDEDVLLEAVRQKQYGMIVLTGSEWQWEYQGLVPVSHAMLVEIGRNYRRIHPNMKYIVMVPRE